MMLAAFLSLGLGLAAAPVNDFGDYEHCLRMAEINDPPPPETPVIVAFSRAIDACAAERERLVLQLLERERFVFQSMARGRPPASEYDRAVVSNRANRRVVDFEIETLSRAANLIFETPGDPALNSR